MGKDRVGQIASSNSHGCPPSARLWQALRPAPAARRRLWPLPRPPVWHPRSSLHRQRGCRGAEGESVDVGTWRHDGAGRRLLSMTSQASATHDCSPAGPSCLRAWPALRVFGARPAVGRGEPQGRGFHGPATHSMQGRRHAPATTSTGSTSPPVDAAHGWVHGWPHRRQPAWRQVRRIWHGAGAGPGGRLSWCTRQAALLPCVGLVNGGAPPPLAGCAHQLQVDTPPTRKQQRHRSTHTLHRSTGLPPGRRIGMRAGWRPARRPAAAQTPPALRAPPPPRPARRTAWQRPGSRLAMGHAAVLALGRRRPP